MAPESTLMFVIAWLLASNAPPSVVAVRVVKVPAAADAPPMVVPSIAPASMSTLVILTSPVPFGVRSMLPSVLVEVMALPERFRLSTASSELTVTLPVLSAIEKAAVPSLALTLVTSRLVRSKVVAFNVPVVILVFVKLSSAFVIAPFVAPAPSE